MMKVMEKICGTCYYFEYEDTEGYGICNLDNEETNCWFGCEKYESGG